MGALDGRVAVITGAARGQGRSHAVTLAGRGADIIAIDVCTDIETVPYAGATVEDLHETAAQVERLGRRVITTVADVRNHDELTAAIDGGVAEFGRLDIVSANAGIVSYAPATALSPRMWTDMIDVNLTGVWNTTAASIPHLIDGGRGGVIVMTSSIAGLRAFAGASHYVAAKHGVLGLMKALATELAPHGIRVNALNPTQVDTAMIMNEPTMRLFCPGQDDPTASDFAAASKQLTLLDVPWVDPGDVSNALAFLVSDDARYLTGVALPVDAGAAIK
jgi:SDR family mycofactocin-dependent oxidoreductase